MESLGSLEETMDKSSWQ